MNTTSMTPPPERYDRSHALSGSPLLPEAGRRGEGAPNPRQARARQSRATGAPKAALLSFVAALTLAFCHGVRADAYEDLAKYDWNSSRQPLSTIEQEIRDAATPDALAAIEKKLIPVLLSDKAGYPAKQAVCRMLRRMGSKQSVPALSALLADKQLSHMARFALTGMGCPEAGTALKEALAKTSGDLKIGLIDSVGRRRNPADVPALAKLLADTAMARAAIRALGNIGGKEAFRALSGAKVAGDLSVEMDDAILKCADAMLAAGEDAGIYDTLVGPGNPKTIRVAALRGLVLAKKENAVGRLLELLSGEDEDLSRAAAKYIIETPGSAMTKALAVALGRLRAAPRTKLLNLLSERADKAASPAVAGLMGSRDEATRVAAIKALAVLGDASCVPFLAKAAIASGETGKAAIETLNTIRSEGVGEAMSRLLDSGNPAVKAGIIKVMATRGDRTVAPAMLKAAADKDPNIRRDAINGLAGAAGPEQVPGMLALLLACKDDSERSTLSKALSKAALRADDPVECSGAIATALKKANSTTKLLLIATLGKLGGANGLAAVRRELNGGNADITRAAVKALYGWPDASPAEDLLKVMKTTEDPVCKTLAFRGYIRMANLVGATSSEQAGDMYGNALALATAPAEKKALLGGLSDAHSLKALALGEGLLADAGVRAEAELAAVRIAGNVRQADPDKARATLKKVVAGTKNSRLAGEAKSVLDAIDKNRGFVVTWLISGPYTEGDAFGTAFAPEKKGAAAKWEPLSKGVGPQSINLLEAVGGSNRAVYLKTGIYSPAGKSAKLEIGSDDGVKVWVNGKLAHAKNATRPLRLGEDKADARLEKGWNTLLVKVCQGGGDWATAIRICDPAGGALEGMRVSINEAR